MRVSIFASCNRLAYRCSVMGVSIVCWCRDNSFTVLGLVLVLRVIVLVLCMEIKTVPDI